MSHQLQRQFPLHGQILETREEGLLRQEVKKYNLGAAKTKSNYTSRMEDFASPQRLRQDTPT